MSQDAMFRTCDGCGCEHDDGNWMLCHLCAGPAFRAWYVAGMVSYGDACAIFAGLLGALLWRAS